MAHQHAHCTGKRPRPAQTAQYVSVGLRGHFRRESFLRSGEPFGRCGGSTLHEADVDDRCHHRALPLWLPAPSWCWSPGAGNSVNALSTGDGGRRPGDGTAGSTGTGGATGGGGNVSVGNDPVQRRHRQRRRREDRLRRSGVRRAARQRRELVRDRHPGRQRRRLQAGLLLRRQLGHGQRRLHVAAQVRSDEHQRRLSVRPGLRRVARERVFGVVVAVAEVHRQLPQAGAERLRLLRLLRGPRRARRRSGWCRPAPPPTSTIRSSARAARR